MEQIVEALLSGAGILWKALWALIFGYTISTAIQVVVTRAQMGKTLGHRGAKQIGLAGFFGFVSSSCSFAALAASRSILTKGAHPVNAGAFLIASTNLVIELGIVLWVLLGWRFALANWLLGVLMIVYLALLTRLWFPSGLAEAAREHAEQAEQAEGGRQHDMAEDERTSWTDKVTSRAGWQAIADAFVMEWKMAYKEILFGFTVAGFIAVFVPDHFWNALLLNEGSGGSSLLALVENALIAPVIAVFTFIGSMGNVPLAALLWSKDAAFGGVMAFLAADLVAATVVYVNAKYYGWRYTLVLSALLYVCMVAAGLSVHGLFALAGQIPTARPVLTEQVGFAIDYTFRLNLVFLPAGAALFALHLRGAQHQADANLRHRLLPWW